MSRAQKTLGIVMVVATPFPANHGTPGSIREMAAAIAAQGHRVHIVTYHFGDGAPPEQTTIHRIPDLGFSRKVVVGPTWERFFLDLLMVFTLYRVLRKEKIDIIHAHNYEGALVGSLVGRLTGKPVIYHAINTMGDELPTYNFFKSKRVAVWLAGILDYWVPRPADRIIAISQELAQFLRGRGIHPKKITVIPLGIDLAVFEKRSRSTARRRYDLGDRPLVIYTGILDQLQRLDYLLKAMRRVADRLPESRLLIAANIAKEDDVRACRSIIADLRLEPNVVIATDVPFEEVPLLLAAADVAVLSRPSCPGFPVKLLNYLAARKPVVLFAGSAKGLRHMENALVVDDHDWQALGEGIIALLQDRGLAENIGVRGHHWVTENFSWPQLTERTEAVYYELLASGDKGKVKNERMNIERRTSNIERRINNQT